MTSASDSPCMAMQCCTCAVYSHSMSPPVPSFGQRVGLAAVLGKHQEVQPQHKDIARTLPHLAQAGGRQQLALNLGRQERWTRRLFAPMSCGISPLQGRGSWQSSPGLEGVSGGPAAPLLLQSTAVTESFSCVQKAAAPLFLFWMSWVLHGWTQPGRKDEPCACVLSSPAL